MKQVVTILKQFEGNKDLKFKMQTLLKELFPFLSTLMNFLLQLNFVINLILEE